MGNLPETLTDPKVPSSKEQRDHKLDHYSLDIRVKLKE